MSFNNAHPSLARALAERGYNEPTPVQAAVLDAPGDRDLLVSAQTGSGKTVAFGLAIAKDMLGDAEKWGVRGTPVGLIIAPTRELAIQVQRELYWLYAETGARIVTCVGGMDIRREQRVLADGVHIVVGTPGRLCDHLDRGHLILERVRALILDEADEMLDLGFAEELEMLLRATPTERRTLMFSATVPKEIESMASKFQRDALRIATTSAGEQHSDIEYRAVTVAPRERDLAIVNLLRHVESPGAIVFCATREGVAHLHANLLERGFHAVALSGQLSQNERSRALQALRDQRARVLVATDVAARGLDLPNLGLVIHGDLPRDHSALLHRSGRTGRAGKKGLCVVIVPMPQRRMADRLFKAAKVVPEWCAPPSRDQIAEKDHLRLLEELKTVGTDAAEEDLEVARALLAERPAEELVAAWVRSLRAERPTPEDLPLSLATAGDGSRSSSPPPNVEGAIWFRLSIGRADNAHPLWIIPLICRRGKVAKGDIGKIKVLERETRFEIAPAAAERFEANSRHLDRREPHVRFQRLPV